MPKVYLDHHTATRPLPSSIDAMLPFLREKWGSSAAPHQMGQELLPVLSKNTESILQSLGACSRDKFYFFSSSEEAINHIFLSHYLDAIRNSGKNHIVTSAIEEAPILMALKRLEDLGCHGKILSVDAQGQITKHSLDEAVKARTSLLSISWANGLTGVIHPLVDLAEVCHSKGICLHVDASYVIGKLYFRLEDLPIDYLTFDGSFLHAPKGTAGLIVKEKSHISPPLSSFMGVSVGGIAALSKGLEECCEQLDHMCLETARLRDKLEKGILNAIADAVVLFSQVERLPNCSAIAFPGAYCESLLFLLHQRGICASLGGGHCQKLSHLLVASHVDATLAECALSFTLSFETQEAEIDFAIEMVVECVGKLKSLSHQLMKAEHEPL